LEIENSILNTNIMQKLIAKDFNVATKINILNLEENISIGIHQIRYLVQNNTPSYSSPMWLHRDDEAVVFSHLFNITNNSIGANFLVAENSTTINQVYFLDKPLDTIVVTQKPLHAITPLGTKDGMNGYRDIVLVTFSN
jgi:L-isoleucine 4-hydroxylase